jgi:hypothetical protein
MLDMEMEFYAIYDTLNTQIFDSNVGMTLSCFCRVARISNVFALSTVSVFEDSGGRTGISFIESLFLAPPLSVRHSPQQNRRSSLEWRSYRPIDTSYFLFGSHFRL